jgi:hypothetical protein
MGRLLTVTLALALLCAAPAGAKKRTDYGKAAASTGKKLAAATTDKAARRQLLAVFKHANVTVLGVKGRKRKVLVRGFARSARDLFLTEPQVRGLARLARQRTQVPMSRFALGLSQITGTPVSADDAAAGVAAWVAEGRQGKAKDAGVFLPRLLDAHAKARGADLAGADTETKLAGVEVFLIGMTLAPARSTARGRRSATAAAISCRELNQGSGIGSWLARKFARHVVSLVDRVLPAGLTVQAISQAAVALATDVRVAPGSEPKTGAAPVHWQHFDQGTPDVRRYKLEFVSDLPVPDALAQCLQLAGLDVPEAGARRPDVPVIWWLDEGISNAPELSEQTLRQQGAWETEGPRSSLSQIADLVSGLTGGQLVGSSASDASGVATARFTPRREEGPYPGAADHLKGELLAIPLTAGTERGWQQAANVFSAVARNVTFEVDVEHHVKIGWQFARRTGVDYTTPCQDTGCPIDWHWEFEAFRCLPNAFLRQQLDPLTPGDRPVGIAGQWHGIPGSGFMSGEGQSQPWHPLFVVPADAGASAGIGNHSAGVGTPEEGSVHMFRREGDTAASGRITIEHYNDFDADSETPFTKGPEESMELVPLRVSSIPPSFDICERKEKLPSS